MKLTKMKIENNGLKLIIDYLKGVVRDIVSLDSVEYIEDDEFYYFPSFENVVLPDSVECIEDNAFDDCTSLEKIVIPTYTR